MNEDDMSIGSGEVVPEDNDVTPVMTPDEGGQPGGEAINPFDMSIDDGEDGDGGGEGMDGEDGAGEEFALEVPDGIQVSDEQRGAYESIAAELGIPGGKAGKYIGRVLQAEREVNAKVLNAQEDALREEWGADFGANVKAARVFARQLAGRAGVDMAVMGVFASPAGYKLLHALRTAVGESGYVSGRPSNQGSNESEAHRMITDPGHPLYAAMYDSEHPKHKEAQARYNKLRGFNL